MEIVCSGGPGWWGWLNAPTLRVDKYRHCDFNSPFISFSFFSFLEGSLWDGILSIIQEITFLITVNHFGFILCNVFYSHLCLESFLLYSLDTKLLIWRISAFSYSSCC